MTTDKLGRFNHHPNPAIDFCAEVDALEGLVYEATIGNTLRAPVIDRIYSALDFTVGGDVQATAAKDNLRRMAEQTGQWRALTMTEGAAQNTDIEIWRERPGDYYADCVFVTQGGGLGINVGGNVVVMPIKAWHRLGADQVEARHAASISDCDQREALARQAEQVAEAFERNIGDHRQARTVPEPQLSKLKAQHWRIMAGWIRRSGGDVESTPSAKEN